MGDSRIAVVIPARFASERFPGKLLADLHGRPLLAHVVEAALAMELGPVVVATDDDRIVAVAGAAGAGAVMTRATHASGTDRIAEVVDQTAADIILNIQGDEPLLPVEAGRQCVAPLLDTSSFGMATLAHAADAQDLANPHAVKVVVAADGRALYFSRAAIPFHRDVPAQSGALRHIGVYAYRRDVLLRLAATPRTPLEVTESLEQLRALETGVDIAVSVVDWRAVGVDTPADLEIVRAHLGGG